MTLDFGGRLVLIGAGKMGGAMLEGWLRQGAAASQLIAVDPDPPSDVRALIQRHNVTHHARFTSIGDVRIVVVAVKPQMFDAAMLGLGALPLAHALVISIVAGKTIAALEKHFGVDAAVIRAMPNTPAAIGRGISAVIANHNVSTTQMALATTLLSAIGEVVTVEREAQIDTVTAVSGSGPAYVFYLTECLADAGRKLGLPEELATALARATVSGSGELMRLSGLPAAALRQNVTSPGGTTQAALEVLMAGDGLKPLLERAVMAAEKRSRELAR